MRGRASCQPEQGLQLWLKVSPSLEHESQSWSSGTPPLGALKNATNASFQRGPTESKWCLLGFYCPWGANPDLGSTCSVPGTAKCGKKGEWTPTSLLRHTQKPDSSGGLGPTSPKA